MRNWEVLNILHCAPCGLLTTYFDKYPESDFSVSRGHFLSFLITAVQI